MRESNPNDPIIIEYETLLREHNSVIKEKETVKNGYMKCLNTYDDKEKEFQRLLKLAMF